MDVKTDASNNVHRYQGKLRCSSPSHCKLRSTGEMHCLTVQYDHCMGGLGASHRSPAYVTGMRFVPGTPLWNPVGDVIRQALLLTKHPGH